MRLAFRGLLCLALLSAACAGVRVHSDHDAEIDVTRFQSFAWLEPPLRDEPQSEAPYADPFTHNTLVDKRVRDDTEAALAARGFRKAADGEAPDFQLRYELVSREVSRDYPVFVGGGYGRRGYYSDLGYYRSSSYQEGTLILDVIDPASQRIAWRGWAASQTRDGHIESERLSKTVTAIVERFAREARPELAQPAAAAEE